MSFRVKLTLNSKNLTIPAHLMRIWFPVNSQDCILVSDLKNCLKIFLSRQKLTEKSKINFELEMRVDGYQLMDNFETNDVVRENDEIEYEKCLP